MHSKLKLVLIAAALAMLAGSNSLVAYAAPPADLCSLLTPAQIQKVIGQPFGAAAESKWPPAYGKQPWGSHCEYTSQKGPNVTVTFIAYAESSADVAKQTFEKLSMWFPPKSKQTIGDSAYIDSGGAIHVLKGKIRYYISMSPANEKQLKDLAESVAARI